MLGERQRNSPSTGSCMKMVWDAGEGRKALRVSLRASRGGEWEGREPDPGGDPAPEELGLSALRINQPVRLAEHFCEGLGTLST